MANDGTQATLGGLPLLATQVLSWVHVAGVEPSQRTYLLAPEDAATLLANAGTPIELVIAPAGGAKAKRVRGLYVLSEAPAPDPRHRVVLVSDRRFLWKRTHVLRRYNMRRRTGDVSLFAGNLQTAQFTPQIGYAGYSTNDGNGASWTAEQILKDVIQAVDPTPGLLVDNTNLSTRTGLRVEGVVIDDDGHDAIARAFAAVPGFTGYMDANDNYVLLDTTDGSTGDVLKQLGDPTKAAGVAVLVDTPNLRPQYVDLLYDREIEARLDAKEGSTVSRTPHFLDACIENVLEVTDQQLTLADGRVVGMGTYITFDEFYAAMALLPASAYPPIMRARGQKLNAAFLQNSWFAGRAQQNMSFGAIGQDPVWLRRLGSCFMHLRQTYRIVRSLMDRFLTIQAKRLAIYDATTGTYANAQVFSDHALYSRQQTTAYSSQAMGAPFVTNVVGWQPLLTNAAPTQAVLSILDGDAGIFRIQYGLGQAAAFGAEIVPCQVTTLAGADPSSTPGAGLGLTLESCSLAPSHQLAVVLTVTPAAPNSKKQLHRVRVLPNQAQPYLGQPIGAATGPPLEIRIPATLLTARIPWVDANASAIEQALGMNQAGGTPNDSYVDNLDPINKSDLQALAEATAAAYWATFLPQWEGSQAGYFNPDVRPSGRALAVEHRLDTKGRASTIVTATVQPGPLNPLAKLPDSVRQIVLRYARISPR